MQDLKEIHQRIGKNKHTRADRKRMIAEAFTQSKPYQDTLRELEILRAKKHQLEVAIKADFKGELDEIDRLNLSISTDIELLSDSALSMLMKGETVELTDENDLRYEPRVKVTFKRI